MNKWLAIVVSMMYFSGFFPMSTSQAQNIMPGDTSFEAGTERWLGGQSMQVDDAPFGNHVLELSRPFNHSDIYYGLIKPDQQHVLSLTARA